MDGVSTRSRRPSRRANDWVWLGCASESLLAAAAHSRSNRVRVKEPSSTFAFRCRKVASRSTGRIRELNSRKAVSQWNNQPEPQLARALAGITPRMMAGRRKIGFSRSFPSLNDRLEPTMPDDNTSSESTDPPSSRSEPPSSPPAPAYRTAWPWVLCVIGLDYLSTLAYQPSVAFGAAGRPRPARHRARRRGHALPRAARSTATSPAARRTAAVRPRCWSASSPAGSASCSSSCCSPSARWTSCSRAPSRPRPRPSTSRATRCPAGSRRSTPPPREGEACASNSRPGCAELTDGTVEPADGRHARSCCRSARSPG